MIFIAYISKVTLKFELSSLGFKAKVLIITAENHKNGLI